MKNYFYKLFKVPLYWCYLCSSMKPISQFGACHKEHVIRVRKAHIGFACKRCVRKSKKLNARNKT